MTKRNDDRHDFERLIQGVTLGAIAMYLLDPDKGRRRRARLQDKLQRVANETILLANQATRDAANRLHGMNARLQPGLRADRSLDDLRLIERVRAALGRVVTHPHAIQVGVRGRTVVVSGPILSDEVRDLVDAIHDVPGVQAIENHLDLHERGEPVPSLQGEGRKRTRGDAWPPVMRMGALVSGAILTVYGLGRRSLTGVLLASAASALVRRALAHPAGARGHALPLRSSSADGARQATPPTQDGVAPVTTGGRRPASPT